MFFRQVLHEDLGCASYVLADAGEAAVIDPKWEIGDYLALADEHGFQITHILETHNHADHELRDGPPAGLQPDARPVAVACSAGNRSSLAVSLLRRAGIDNLVHVADGGVADLSEHGVELIKEGAA